MEYLETPVGRVSIPDDLVEPRFTNQTTVAWDGDAVSIYFWRSTNVGDADQTLAGEVVAHVFMTRKAFENRPQVWAAMIEMHNANRLRKATESDTVE